LYDFVVHEVRAWRPELGGVVEVLHARFSDHAYPMHAHDAWTLLIVDDGAVRYDLDRHEHGAFGEVVTLLPPHVPHNGAGASPHGFRKRVLYLDSDQLPAGLVGSSVDHPGVPDPALRRLISRLHQTILQPGERLESESLLAVVQERIRAHLGDQAGPAEPDRGAARQLRDLLEANIVAGVSLKEASESLRYDPAYLVRSFCRTFGMTPHRYLTSRRVDLARRLILDGRALRSVAAESGFYDQPHLSRHFKRILGVTPGRYLRSAGGLSNAD
jgi:AraC-like DNA-binding protein